VPPSIQTSAGMRRHVHSGNHAAESSVSCIRLFGGAVTLQVFWPESSVFGDSRQHSGADFLGVVKRERVVGRATTRQSPVRTRLPLDRPTDALQR
jgi:hypothetical protein